MLSGLLPNLAADLEVSIPDAGLLVSAFAVGIIIGSPLLGVATLRWPPRSAMAAFQIVFIAAHIVGASAPSFSVLLITRVVSAVVYAGFWAVALSAAVHLTPPRLHGRSVAVVASGLTLATIVGVPAGTALSDSTGGWRAAFWTVAALTVLSLALSLVAMPRARIGLERPLGIKAQLRAMARPQLWLSYVITALGFGAMIVTFTYLAPLLTIDSGLDGRWVPAVLALFGFGGLIGMMIGGRLATPYPIRTLLLGLILITVTSALLALLATHVVAAVGLVFALGVAGYVINPTLQSRVFPLAPGAPTLVAATNSSALNVGAALAPMLGGAAIRAGLGFASVAWSGALLATSGIIATIWAGHLQHGKPTAKIVDGHKGDGRGGISEAEGDTPRDF
jgi:DHA1 family chloramphenicol resistance protein-like MFS transporter